MQFYQEVNTCALYHTQHGRQSEPDHGGTHSFYWSDERGGGGGDSRTFFPDIKMFGSIFQTQSRSTHRTSPTSDQQIKKVKSPHSAGELTWKKGPHFNE